MNVTLVLLLGGLWLASADESPSTTKPAATLLYLVPTRPNGLDPRALVGTVALYTKDLHLSVQTTPDDVTAPTPADIDRLAALVQARGASLAVWCAPADDGRTIKLFSVDARGTLGKGVANVAGLHGPDVNRAIALTVRALLAPPGTTNGPPAESPGPKDAGPPGDGQAGRRAPPAPPTAVPPAPPPQPALSPRASEVAAGAAAPVPATAIEWGAVVEYCVAWPTQAAGPHQALALQAIADLGARRSFEVVVGLELAQPVRQSTAAGSGSLFDLPLRLGGRLMRDGERSRTGIGAFGTVHLLSASATSTSGPTVDSLTAAGGAGLEVLLRARAVWRLSWEARLWAERWIPRTWFMQDQQVAVETGGYALGLALGAAFSRP
jgi:hypothetical protein